MIDCLCVGTMPLLLTGSHLGGVAEDEPFMIRATHRTKFINCQRIGECTAIWTIEFERVLRGEYGLIM